MQMAKYHVCEKGNQTKILGVREPKGEGAEIGFLKGTFEDKTEQQIAEEENAIQQSVHIILERALENLKKYLKIKI